METLLIRNSHEHTQREEALKTELSIARITHEKGIQALTTQVKELSNEFKRMSSESAQMSAIFDNIEQRLNALERKRK